MAALGIDLGTTNSCVGVFRHGKVEIIANDHGNRTTPSVVAFQDTGRLIGEPAREQMARNPANTLFSVKRLIGRDYGEPCVQEDMKLWPFTVKQQGTKPTIEVQYQKSKKTFFPDEISAMVLTKMKETAAAYLGETVTKAVITVPAYFNDSQRKATQDAGKIAGLDVLRIINEPTAAAMAYEFLSKGDKEHNVLVFDFGGGTFDVSVLNIEDDIIEVLATNGDTHLGGEDFDNKLVEHFISQFERKYRKDISNNKRAVQRLKNKCEEAKKTLSFKTEARIEIDSLCDQTDFHTSITRARFEHLCGDIFKKLKAPVDKVMSDSKLKKSEIDQIVLVGGSTNIPKVQEDLQSMFHGKPLNKSINPDEAVAFGAAIQAAIMSGDKSAEIFNTVLLDVTPLSLGISTHGKIMSTVVKRNTSIPLKKEKQFHTIKDNQSVIGIRIYEGERSCVEDNKMLDKFRITGIPLAPRGQSKIKVTFEIDTNGTLTVSAKDISGGSTNERSVTIPGNQGHRSQAEIERMISDARKYKAFDMAWKKKIDARQDLDWYIYKLEKKLRNPGLNGHILESDRHASINKCQEVLDWLKRNKEADRRQCETMKRTLDASCQLILEVYASHGLREEDMDKKRAPQATESEKDYTEFVRRFSHMGSFVSELD